MVDPWPAVWCPGPMGAKLQAQRMVSPSEGNEARREGRRKSECLIVALEVGEPVRWGPCRAKGAPRGGIAGGQPVGDTEPRVLSTERRQVAERT